MAELIQQVSIALQRLAQAEQLQSSVTLSVYKEVIIQWRDFDQFNSLAYLISYFVYSYL